MTEEVRILVVDDEEVVRDSLKAWLEETGYPTDVAADAKQALQMLEDGRYRIALVDIKMKGMDGIELTRRVKTIDPTIDVLVITAFASVDTAVQAMKLGAYDYLTKPFDADELCLRIEKLVERQKLRMENLRLRERIGEIEGMGEIVTQSPAMKAVLDLIKDVAQSDISVLIEGESGTGKELVARAIHRRSKRRFMPLVPVNCGGLTETLLESELFGHEKGAFTGAALRKKGRFELADGGTIFLDEIGDISAKMQVELLRVLEEKQFYRVGGTRPVECDFRLIAATHRNLEDMVRQGTFREDLYYRVNRIRIRLPPLRERGDDVVLLATHFLQRFSQEAGRRFEGFTPEALEALRRYPWPGNVRELENAIERAVVVEKGSFIAPESFPFQARPEERLPQSSAALREVEKRHILQVLRAENWNVSRAAQVLEVDRGTLYNKMRKYGFDVAQMRDQGAGPAPDDARAGMAGEPKDDPGGTPASGGAAQGRTSHQGARRAGAGGSSGSLPAEDPNSRPGAPPEPRAVVRSQGAASSVRDRAEQPGTEGDGTSGDRGAESGLRASGPEGGAAVARPDGAV